MFFSQQRLPVSWTGLIVALIGAVFCGLQIVPEVSPIPCSSAGCRLFQDFSFKGVSLWWLGVAYFAVMALVCMRRSRTPALALASLALVADGALLVVMLLTAPCTACLGAAAFIGLLFYVIRRHVYNKSAPPPGPSVLFLAWAGLFIAALVNAGTDLVGSWQIYGPQDAERRVYFSPSCPACRDAITAFAESAAFMPIAEEESDYAAIYRMRRAVAQGKNIAEALREAENDGASEPWSLESALFRLKLLRNKAEVLHLGFERVPLILINGLPQSLRSNYAPAARDRYAPSAALPPELAPIDSCGESIEPCETPH